LLSTLGVPIGYATNIVVGRTSPEALGIYGLLGIFVTFTTTFILFGGNNAFAKYLPEMGAKKQAAFLSSYALVIFAIAVPITIILYSYPQILSALLGQQFPQNFLSYFVIFVPILLLFFIFNYALNGLLELRTSVIIGQLMTLSNFLFFTFMYFFYHSFFSENLWLIIFGFSIALYGFLVLLQSLILEKKLRGSQSHTAESKRKVTKRQDDAIKQKASISSFKLKMPKLPVLDFFLPTGIWSFVFFANNSTIVFFFADKLDQIFAIHYLGINGFGLYYAALQTATMVRFIPLLLAGVLLPTFSHLIAIDEKDLIQKSYQMLVRYNTLIVVPAAMFCIFFSKQLMGLFGPEYTSNYVVLVVLASCFSTSISSINNSIIIAKGKMRVYFLGETTGAIVGGATMFVLVQTYGALGLAIGKGFIFILWQAISSIIALRLLDLGLTVPKTYIVGLMTTAAALTIYLLAPPHIWLIDLILFLLFSLFFLRFARLSKADLQFMVHSIAGLRADKSNPPEALKTDK